MPNVKFGHHYHKVENKMKFSIKNKIHSARTNITFYKTNNTPTYIRIVLHLDFNPCISSKYLLKTVKKMYFNTLNNTRESEYLTDKIELYKEWVDDDAKKLLDKTETDTIFKCARKIFKAIINKLNTNIKFNSRQSDSIMKFSWNSGRFEIKHMGEFCHELFSDFLVSYFNKFFKSNNYIRYSPFYN